MKNIKKNENLPCNLKAVPKCGVSYTKLNLALSSGEYFARLEMTGIMILNRRGC